MIFQKRHHKITSGNHSISNPHRSSMSTIFSTSTTCNFKASVGGTGLNLRPKFLPLIWPWQKLKVGPLSVSPMGLGTWAWGNQLLWGYQESMDAELQRTFNLAVNNGINLFDTADSYGTGKFNGQSERLLGKFIRDFQGLIFFSFSLTILDKFGSIKTNV